VEAKIQEYLKSEDKLKKLTVPTGAFITFEEEEGYIMALQYN
jgi:hypothetical protein